MRPGLQEGALKRIGQCLKSPLTTKVHSILLDAPWAVVEMQAVNVDAKAGWPYNNSYCWVCRFEKVCLLLFQSVMCRPQLTVPDRA